MEKMIVNCKKCQAKLALPPNAGILEVTCPKCKYVFRCDTGAKSAGPKRKLIFIYWTERIGHSMDKLENAFAQNFQLRLYVDAKQAGVMVQKQTTEIEVSTGEHRLWASITPVPLLSPNRGLRIPAGNDDWIVFVNKAGSAYELCGGPGRDPFLESLQAFIRNMFSKQGICDRIMMPNNRRKEIELSFTQDYIRIFWTLNQTKGLNQWSLGGDEEKIYYHNVGLMAPKNMPQEYWTYVRFVIASDINEMEEYTCTPNGAVRIRTVHNLY